MIDIRRAFTLATYTIVLTGILSLSIAEGSPLTIAISTGLALLAYQRAERLGRTFGRLGTNLLVALVVVLSPLDFLAVTGDVVLTIAHFLLAVSIVKLFGKKEARDYFQLYMISLMHLGVSAVITIELAFSIAFVTYMVVGMWTLVLFLLVRELETRAPEDPARIRAGRGILFATALVSLGTLGLTTVFFFGFPRFSAVLFDIRRRHQTQRLTGFQDNIALNDLSQIKENPDVVMRIIPEGYGTRFPAEPKWRGLSFDRYEGGRWKRSWQKGTAVIPSGAGFYRRRREADGRDVYTLERRDLPPAPDDAAARYTVFLAPLGLDAMALFGVPDVTQMELLSQDRPAAVILDAGDALIGEALPPTDVKYRVTTVPRRREVARQAQVVPDGRIGRFDFLQLPLAQGDFCARLSALAEEVIAQAGAETPYEKAEALEKFLSTKFRYTLDLTPAPDGKDPIEHFLFESKEGHCELSASAFVLMCRTQGIPARLVNGFQTGQWNDLGGYWQVRQMEAHAWAEAHFVGEAGWVDFDPTPWSAGGGGILSAIEKMRDYLALRWLNYVISFKLSDQLSFADRIRERLKGMRQALMETLNDLKRFLPSLDGEGLARALFALAIATGMVGVAVWLLLSTRGRRSGNGRGARRARRVPFYEELLRQLERRGYRRRPAETAREFAARVAAQGGVPLAGAREVTEAFYRVRFGELGLAPDEEARVAGVLGALSGRPDSPFR